MRIAVTGNIGCGKSTVCAQLHQLLPDYGLFSVDDAVRALYNDPAFQAALQAKFGTSDRKALSDLVFAQPALKKTLEDFASSYLVPTIRSALAAPKVIVEFPLLFEMPGWAPQFDFVLALACDPITQRQRVVQRDGISEEKFERIRAAQYPSALKASLADAFIDTSQSLAEVTQAIQALVPHLRSVEQGVPNNDSPRWRAAFDWHPVNEEHQLLPGQQCRGCDAVGAQFGFVVTSTGFQRSGRDVQGNRQACAPVVWRLPVRTDTT
jgi:dephospho-CoA kinase